MQLNILHPVFRLFALLIMPRTCSTPRTPRTPSTPRTPICLIDNVFFSDHPLCLEGQQVYIVWYTPCNFFCLKLCMISILRDIQWVMSNDLELGQENWSTKISLQTTFKMTAKIFSMSYIYVFIFFFIKKSIFTYVIPIAFSQ